MAMEYSEKVMEHFAHPHNVGTLEDANGVGEVGNAKCGDIMRMYLKISDDEIIEDVKFQTFGCASVYESTLTAIRAAGLTFCPGPLCPDVDVPEDLRRLRRTVRPDSHTGRLLNTLHWEENDK